MNIMIAYDNSRNARKALDATLEMFGPLKPLIMLIGVVEETRDTSDSAVELYERERREFRPSCGRRRPRSAPSAWTST